MRLSRLGFFFTAFFIVLITGTYFYQVLAMRILHHALITGLMVAYALWAARRGGLPQSQLTVPILGAIGLWLVTALFSIDPRVSLENAWFPVTHATITLFLIDLVRRGRDKLLVEAQFLLASVVVMFALLHLGSWYFGWGIAPATSVGWASVGLIPLIPSMIYMPLGVSTWLAAYTAPLLILSVGHGVAARRRDLRIALWGLALGLLIALIATFSRGGLVALAAGGSAWVGLWGLRALLRGVGRLRLLLPVVGVIAIAGAALALVFVIGWSEGRVAGDALRFNLWADAIEMIATDPITGVGPGMFGRAAREAREPEVYYDDRLGTAHNAYLNTFAETGILGIALMGVFAVVIGRAWWGRWRRLDAAGQSAARVRHEVALAALIAFGAQSIFDTFVVVPLALLTGVLVVLVAVEPGDLAENPPKRQKGMALALAVLIALYGVGQLVSDSLYRQFREAPDLAAVQEVRARDPYLGLYALQEATLLGQAALDGDGDLSRADAAYALALAGAPSWDTGWINRAALAEQRGDIPAAVGYLERAYAINLTNGARFLAAQVMERAGMIDEEAIIQGYMTMGGLPLSSFWQQTPLRRATVLRLIEQWRVTAPDSAYRAARAHAPEQLDAIYIESLPRAETEISAMWVVGEHALTVLNDATLAFMYFDRVATQLRINGDAYAARARARSARGPADAQIERDLLRAELLGVIYESPNAIRAQMTTDVAQQRALWANAIPPQVMNQNFEGVSYAGRAGDLRMYATFQFPGRGRLAMAAWYALAESYLDTNEPDRARNVYRAILEVSPDEEEAVARWAALGAP